MALYPPLWMQEGTYPAQLDRWVIQDALGPNAALLGTSGSFQVTQRGAGANMSVDVAAGRALIPGSDVANQGCYSVWSDATVNVAIATAPGAGQSRIDLIVLRVRDDYVIGGGNNDFQVTVVQGTAATTGSQVAPTAPASSMTLAQVLVGPNVASIVTSNITDTRPSLRSSGGGGYSVVQGPASPNPNAPTISPPLGLLWVDPTTAASWTPYTIPGPGVPTGGAVGQYLQKRSGTDYDTMWANAGTFTYYQTLTAPTAASSPYTVTHNLNTLFPLVQVWDAVTGLQVGVQVKVTSANAVQISVTQNMPNNVNVVVHGTTTSTAPIQAGDLATKAYVDARTPNIPPAVTSGGFQSFTDALGDVWVASNTVASGVWKRARDVLWCRVWKTVASNYPTGTTDALVVCDSGSDAYGMYNNTTGIWTAPIPGNYSYAAQVGATATATGQALRVSIVHGTAGSGAVNMFATAHSSGALSLTANCTDLNKVVAGDTWSMGACCPLGGVALAALITYYWNQFTVVYLGTG